MGGGWGCCNTMLGVKENILFCDAKRADPLAYNFGYNNYNYFGELLILVQDYRL